jgi:V/A-type H+-transporting ATPase subunit B
MRGNLLTVIAENVTLGEMARIHKHNGESTYASVLRIDGDKVTLQAFENTRGIGTHDRVSFLGKQMEGVVSDALLGRRFNGSGEPIDKGTCCCRRPCRG